MTDVMLKRRDQFQIEEEANDVVGLALNECATYEEVLLSQPPLM
jgi:hypothetical protein